MDKDLKNIENVNEKQKSIDNFYLFLKINNL